jgi:hypothetical protein
MITWYKIVTPAMMGFVKIEDQPTLSIDRVNITVNVAKDAYVRM